MSYYQTNVLLSIGNDYGTRGTSRKMNNLKKYLPGVILSLGIAVVAYMISSFIPAGILEKV